MKKSNDQSKDLIYFRIKASQGPTRWSFKYNFLKKQFSKSLKLLVQIVLYSVFSYPIPNRLTTHDNTSHLKRNLVLNRNLTPEEN